MTLFSDKMLISHRCIRGLMPNLIKENSCLFLAKEKLNYTIFDQIDAMPHSHSICKQCFVFKMDRSINQSDA